MVNIYIGQNIALHLYETREILVYEKYLILQQQKREKELKIQILILQVEGHPKIKSF